MTASASERTVLIVSSLATCVLAGVIAVAGSPDAKVPRQLTIEQTLALVPIRNTDVVVVNGKRSEPPSPLLVRAANKEARGALYRILAKEALRDYHAGALSVLGHVGDAKDAANIVEIIKNFTGTLNPSSQNAMAAGMYALGVMASRGIPEAEQALLDMCRPAYWRARSCRWFADETLREQPELRYFPVRQAIFAYGVTTGKRPDALIVAALDDSNDLPADARTRFGGQLDRKGIESLRQDRERAASRPITDADLVALDRIYERDKAILSGNEEGVSAEEAAFLATTVTEALAAFATMQESIVTGQMDTLKNNVLDDGEIPEAGRIERLWNEMQRDLKREEVVFAALAEHTSVPAAFAVQRIATYTFAGVPIDGPIKATKTEAISVTAKMTNSAEIGNALFKQRRNNLTVDKDGTLLLVMKKIDGKWYWNPFGW